MKLKIQGNISFLENYSLEFADSPSKMWSFAGSRKISFIAGGKKHVYDIPDELFRFVVKDY